MTKYFLFDYESDNPQIYIESNRTFQVAFSKSNFMLHKLAKRKKIFEKRKSMQRRGLNNDVMRRHTSNSVEPGNIVNARLRAYLALESSCFVRCCCTSL